METREPQAGKTLDNVKVLVAEDEPLIAVAVVQQLSDAGANVIGPWSTTGGALAALDEHEVDVAIVDYVLSDDKSDDLQAELERKGIPFVVVTGYPRVLVRRDMRQRVLSKPVPPDVLAATLRSLARV